MKRKLVVGIVLLGTLLSSGCREPLVTQSAFLLDTFVTITVYGGTRQTVEEAIDLCRYYDKIFNRHDEDSELYRLNHAGGAPVTVSPALREAIAAALDYCAVSEGYYDITIAPVMDLWEFRSKGAKPPSQEAVAQALERVDYRNVILDGEAVALQNGAMIDLGSIAKGYIADRIGDLLRNSGVEGAIINLGGNVLTLGRKTDGKDFEIGIQKPFGAADVIIGTVKVGDASVVSSGLYERYFEYEDEFYHHILDAHNGYPTDTDLLSVTILSSYSVDGDALSTLCFLLGSEDAMTLIEAKNGVEAIFIVTDGSVRLSSNVNELYQYQSKA